MKRLILLVATAFLNYSFADEILSQKEDTCLKSLNKLESNSIEYTTSNNTNCIREQVRQNITSGVGTNHFRPFEIRILNTPNNELDLQSATAVSMSLLTSMRNAQYIAIANNIRMSDALATVESTLQTKAKESYEQSAKHNRGFAKNDSTFQSQANEIYRKIEKIKESEISRLNQLNNRPTPSQNLGGHLNDNAGVDDVGTRVNESNTTSNTPTLNPRYSSHITKLQNQPAQPCLREIEKHKKAGLTQEDSYALARACQFYAENQKIDLAEKTLEASQRLRYVKQGKLSADTIPQDERNLTEQIASFYKDRNANETLQKKVRSAMQMPDVNAQWKNGAGQALEASQTYQAAADAAFLDFQIGIAKQLLKMSWVTLDTVLTFTPFIGTAKDFMEGTVGYRFDGGKIVKISKEERAFLLAGVAVSASIDLAIISPSAIRYLAKGSNIEAIKEATTLAQNTLNTATSIIKHTPINPGRLHDVEIGSMRVSDTFRSGTYITYTNTEPLKLYRVYSAPDEFGHMSKYWSKTKPSSPTQVMIDNALDPSWGNSAIKWIEIDVPKGQQVYEGISASIQRIGNNMSELVGGGNQVYLDYKIPTEWIIKQRGF